MNSKNTITNINNKYSKYKHENKGLRILNVKKQLNKIDEERYYKWIGEGMLKSYGIK